LISTLLIALAAMAIAVLGCALVAPVNWLVGHRESKDDGH
jgi:hypothetical protein